MQRELLMDLPQEFLQSIGQNAMPGNKCWACMDVHAMEVRILVDVFLLVPVRYAVRVELGRIELEESVE